MYSARLTASFFREGRLLGINTAILSGSGGSQGVGFAIPVATAEGVLRLSPEQGVADRYGQHAARGAHLIALLDAGCVAHDDGADRVLVEVECHAHEATGELEEL